MENKVKPFKRDWLGEAYKIACGDPKIKIKREHVEESIRHLLALSRESTNLRNMMKQAYEAACKRRQENGMPVPPPPKSFESELRFPWKL